MVAAENLPHLKEIPIVERSVEPCDPTGENLVLDDALAAKAGTDFEKVERLEIEIVGDLGIRRRGQPRALGGRGIDGAIGVKTRSEEHTSELQSLMRISYAVFCLKKKTHKKS